MSEDFLHYIWKFKKFEFHNLKTVAGDALNIRSGGTHNLNSGPDFFNSQLQINNQLWAGNVEIHVKSSDWYVHNHETDKAYDNVILHVVWEHDTDIFRKDNTKIDTLELKDYVAKNVLLNYQHLLAKKHNAINCERDFATVNDFVMNNWLERLYFERLERKSTIITSLLKNSKYNWEAVLFKLLTKNFGLNVNGDAFMSLANSLNFSIVRKVSGHQINLEALLFGQSHLLDIDSEDAYLINLIKRYSYQSHKFNLNNKNVIKPQFFRLRPQNFPTIRLSQLASLYHEQKMY